MSTPTKFRKKPVVIEAMELRGSTQAYAVYQWIESHIGSTYPQMDDERNDGPSTGVTIDPADGKLVIRTLEGDMKADLGDFIIKGVNGEFYPCKPDIFAKTYELATEEVTITATGAAHVAELLQSGSKQSEDRRHA